MCQDQIHISILSILTVIHSQRYYWQKRAHEVYGEDQSRFPIFVTFAVEDAFKALTPEAPLVKTLEAAEQAVSDMERELSKQIEAVLPPGMTIGSLLARSPPPQDQLGDGNNLGVIAEENEDGIADDVESRGSGSRTRRRGRKGRDEWSLQGDESPRTLVRLLLTLFILSLPSFLLFSAPQTTDMNLGQAHCPALEAPTLDLWLEITKSF
jgi:hypothetical protein